MEIHFVLITLGGLFLIGLATDELADEPVCRASLCSCCSVS